jgi:hypothetical protein
MQGSRRLNCLLEKLRQFHQSSLSTHDYFVVISQDLCPEVLHHAVNQSFNTLF